MRFLVPLTKTEKLDRYQIVSIDPILLSGGDITWMGHQVQKEVKLSF
jgi:hypothetical protein